jgi:microcystin degradation protein MlrC
MRCSEIFWDEIKPVLVNAIENGLDGIFLSLHGAMVTTELEDPDGELLERIRALPGAARLPIFGVFDLHGTMTQKMGDLSDGLVCYRECPHDDTFESAVRATELLARCLESGVRPRQHVLVTPIVWPPTGTGTKTAAWRCWKTPPAVWSGTFPAYWRSMWSAAIPIPMFPTRASPSAS